MPILDSKDLPKFIKVNQISIYSYSTYYRSETIITNSKPIYIDIESILYINTDPFQAVKKDSNKPNEYYAIHLKYNLISGTLPDNKLYVDYESFKLITKNLYLID